MQDEIDTYARDGVVHVPGMFDQEWIERLLTAWSRVEKQFEEKPLSELLPERVLADPLLREEIDAEWTPETAKRRAGFRGAKWMRFWDPDFRAFVFESPAAEIVGRVTQSREVRFYWDQMFAKWVGCTTPTYWHNDTAAWPVTGGMLPSLWLALTPGTHANSLECVAGTQHDTTPYWPRTYNARKIQRPEGRPDFIDYETRRGDPSVEFRIFDMAPGDVLLFHPAVYHGAGGNNHPTQQRIALSTRWIGEDIRWSPRPECVNTPGLALEDMIKGARPDDQELFPLVWSSASVAEAA